MALIHFAVDTLHVESTMFPQGKMTSMFAYFPVNIPPNADALFEKVFSEFG